MRNLVVRTSVVCGMMILGACDQIFDLTSVTLPTAPLDDAPPDTPADGAEEWGFSMLQPVLGVNHNITTDAEPTLTSDMTEIYFRSTRPGGFTGDDIWYSTRATVGDPWSIPALSSLSTTENESQPRLAPNGRTFWFRRGAGATARLMVSKRTSVKDDTSWSTPAPLTEFDATFPGGAEDAALMSSSPTQVVGFLISRRSTGAKVRIYSTARVSDTVPWGTPTEVTELLGSGNYEQSPWVTPDQLTMIFDSDRPGCVGGGDIWLATRTSPGAAFGAPICLRELSNFSYESGPWISPDLRHVFFRSSATGNGDIWEAHR